MCMGKFSIGRGREKDLKATQKGPIARSKRTKAQRREELRESIIKGKHIHRSNGGSFAIS